MAIFNSKLTKAINQVEAFVKNLQEGIDDNQEQAVVLTDIIFEAEVSRDALIEQSIIARNLVQKIKG